MADKVPQKFIVFGTSSLAAVGGFKARFANDMTRVNVLETNGHTDIELIQLPEGTPPKTKAEGIDWLLGNADYCKKIKPEALAALKAAKEHLAPKPPKEPGKRGRKKAADATGEAKEAPAAGAQGEGAPPVKAGSTGGKKADTKKAA